VPEARRDPLDVEPDDRGLILDLRHRLAVETLASVKDRGAVEKALRTLETLATSAESERVRHAAARDLARFAREIANPPGAKVSIDARGATITAGDLVTSLPAEALREATARRLAAGPPVIEVEPAREQGGTDPAAAPAPGEGGSEGGGGRPGEGYPPSESDRPKNRPGPRPADEGACPW
jgi:hypothetical protein